MSTILSPKQGMNKLREMLGEDVALETRGWAARWYAEMLVELFLSKTAKQRHSNFVDLSLGDKIKAISAEYSSVITEPLFYIENIGNKAAHYHPDKQLTHSEVELAVTKATGLFDLIIIEVLKKHGLDNTANTMTILSTVLPSIRINVLREFIDFKSLNSDWDIAILDRYIMALVKNNQREKARRLTRKLHKQQHIPGHLHKYWENKINTIHHVRDELPIAKDIADCKRNLENMLQTMDREDKQKNAELIQLLTTMYDKVEPSEFGTSKGHQLFLQPL